MEKNIFVRKEGLDSINMLYQLTEANNLCDEVSLQTKHKNF